ncbi:MAG: toll/interleukin-1 receptor domain-containing protein [Rhodomicrobium sp.]
MAQKVFISYRRDDTAPAAGRLYDRFCRLLGKENVFLDVGAIDAGENFEEKIGAEIAKAGTILVLIGKRWLEPGPDGKPRLLNDRDHVRGEVRAALRGKALAMPVLVDDAAMPKPEDLPDDIAEISKRNAPPLRYVSFDADADHIARKALGRAPGELLWERESTVGRKILSTLTGGLLAAAGIFLIALLHWALLRRSISDSVGGDGQMEALAVVVLIFGLVFGLIYGSRRRPIS